ncbi:MAG: hypothetical protein ACOYN0_05280 [Phycisphaerales bacterium]
MSITTWTRLEPDTQTGIPALDLGEGVAARLADPLWMLGRQWQMGELSGEDAASPVSARVACSSYPIESIRTPAGRIPYAPRTTAAELEVEHDRGAPDRHTRASGGASFLDRLAEGRLKRYTDETLREYPLDPGAPDGSAILADVGATLRTKLNIKPADRDEFDTVVREWASWYGPRARPGVNAAWVPDRLEYRFSMEASVPEGRLTLTAPEHMGGRLDWDAFTAEPPVSGSAAAGTRVTTEVAPALLQIPGMPALGFWELEDPQHDLGRIEAAPGDPARLLLVESVLSYASDWFLLPLRLPVAALHHVDSLEVTDTFGVTTRIRAVEEVRPHPGWRLWRVSGLPYLFLPPPSAGFISGEAVERVAFIRDEAANLAWMLQTVPEGPSVIPALPDFSEDLTFVPLTTVPSDRVPMTMLETPGGRWLVRARMDGQGEGPSGELITPEMRLRDEELPDEGLTLDRRYELGRTPDGELHLWISRTKRAGARRPASGLTFDRVVERPG